LDAPPLGGEDVLERALGGRVVVNDQDADIVHGGVPLGFHPVYRRRGRGRRRGGAGFPGASRAVVQAKQKRIIMLDKAKIRRI
jgi:hypothetical protein